MTVGVAQVRLGARHVLRQPLAVLEGHEPIVSPVPHLDRHADRVELKPPRRHVRDPVVPPTLHTWSQTSPRAAHDVGGDLARENGSVHV